MNRSNINHHLIHLCTHLLIHSVLYSCFHFNSMYLEVLASTRAPYFIKEPTDTYVQRGKSAVLDCLVGGSLKAAITWRKNGIALRDLSQDDRRMIKPNGSLYFSKVYHDTAENSDEGAYQCEALTRNDMNLDFQILSRTARLLVAGKPSLRYQI